MENSNLVDDSHDWEMEQFVDSFDPDHDCPRCSGSGQIPTEGFECYTGDQWKTCPECGGNGTFD
jgi:DnaJ-class molecular chaperone